MGQLKKRVGKLIDEVDKLEGIRKSYIFLIIFLMFFILSIMTYSGISTFNKLNLLYAQYTKDVILDIKKDFLKDSVNNMINSIGRIKNETIKSNKSRMDRADKIIGEYYELNKKGFLEKAINYLDVINTKEPFSTIILDTTTNEILYQNNVKDFKYIGNISDYIEELKSSTIGYSENNYGEYYIFYGVTEDYIKDVTLELVRNRIHGDSFENDAYIWINEVVDYNGGDNYAIRLIHPNLKDTEGIYLSTNEQDIKGKYPYLIELNGIKDKGEVYFTYFFKKKTDDSIAEKLTYAKLYKEYNWIVAMGIYFDDIQPYIDEVSIKGDKEMERMRSAIGIMSLISIIMAISMLLTLEQWYYKNSNIELKEELNIDELTKAFNRRAGTRKLEEIFHDFKRYNKTYAILIIDIDAFKMVNDTYGHAEGDKVLISIVDTINKCIRETDSIYRWGGEEFLLICGGLKEENLGLFTNKVLKNIEKNQYEYQGKYYNVTVSIGISYFNKDDDDFFEVVKRADIGLYKSKETGKNKATLNN